MLCLLEDLLRLWAWIMALMSLVDLQGYCKTAWLSKAVAVSGMGGVGKNLVLETWDNCFDHLIWVT